jgi:hypothetical protein
MDQPDDLPGVSGGEAQVAALLLNNIVSIFWFGSV